ncbi:MAG: c-type cytochrome domain-containing protein, partial [Candidatus Promineifilaceae bacterium]
TPSKDWLEEHEIPSPEEAVDQALSKGLLSQDLPLIKEKSVELLSRDYEDLESAKQGIQSLKQTYADEYPEIYAAKQGEVILAMDTLTDIYEQIAYPDQELDWTTHPDNLGHKDSPGCFRCHDGKHLSSTGEAVRLECNLCHSIPVISDDTVLETDIVVGRGPEPPSHTHTDWIALHGKAVDSSCSACHASDNLELDFSELDGKPPSDGSFCGNSACHDPDWIYSGFDSPELAPYLEQQVYILRNTSPYLLEGVPQTYEATFQAMFEGRCVFCHSGEDPRADLDLSSYENILLGGRSGPAIVPGDPEASLIIQKQTESRDHYGQLLDDEIEALSAWILDGAPQQ